jgi:heat shock protein HslJ
MKTLIAALFTLAALPAAAQTASDPYVARGTEPFWALAIDGRTIKFEAPGRAPVTVPAPKPIHGFAGEIWQTRRIRVNTVHKTCSDGMSDRRYRDTVTVTVDGRRYEGCGGAGTNTAPAPGRASAVEGDWRIERINGRRPVHGTMPTVSFNGRRISGNASCNRFNGSFEMQRGRLNAGPLASTKMACASPLANRQEAQVLRILGERLTVSHNRGGKIVLTGRRGETLTLARGAERTKNGLSWLSGAAQRYIVARSSPSRRSDRA